jgi:rRNA processing protein Krr1/Pno1
MRKIFSEKPIRIIRAKLNLEKITGVNIKIVGKEISLEGNPEDEFIAEKIVDALNFGFPFAHAITIKQDNFHFEILDIKDYTPRKDLETIRARIIGRCGRTLKTLETLSGCFFEINLNRVGIIGPVELIKDARESILALIRGSKQANVYRNLEKKHFEPVEDLGIKKSFEKKLKNKNIDIE